MVNLWGRVVCIYLQEGLETLPTGEWGARPTKLDPVTNPKYSERRVASEYSTMLVAPPCLSTENPKMLRRSRGRARLMNPKHEFTKTLLNFTE